MIIGLDNPAKVGEVVIGTYFETPKIHHNNVRIMILKESTYDEWKAYRQSIGKDYYFKDEKAGYFYVVSTD